MFVAIIRLGCEFDAQDLDIYLGRRAVGFPSLSI